MGRVKPPMKSKINAHNQKKTKRKRRAAPKNKKVTRKRKYHPPSSEPEEPDEQTLEEILQTQKCLKKLYVNTKIKEADHLSKLTTKHSLDQSDSNEVFSPVKQIASKISEFNSGSKRQSLSQNEQYSSCKKEEITYSKQSQIGSKMKEVAHAKLVDPTLKQRLKVAKTRKSKPGQKLSLKAKKSRVKIVSKSTQNLVIHLKKVQKSEEEREFSIVSPQKKRKPKAKSKFFKNQSIIDQVLNQDRDIEKGSPSTKDLKLESVPSENDENSASLSRRAFSRGSVVRMRSRDIGFSTYKKMRMLEESPSISKRTRSFIKDEQSKAKSPTASIGFLNKFKSSKSKNNRAGKTSANRVAGKDLSGLTNRMNNFFESRKGRKNRNINSSGKNEASFSNPLPLTSVNKLTKLNKFKQPPQKSKPGKKQQQYKGKDSSPIMEEEGMPASKKSSDKYSKSYPLGHYLAKDPSSSQKKKKQKKRFDHLVKLAMDEKQIVSELEDEMARLSGSVGDILEAPSAKLKYGDLVKGPSFYLYPKFKTFLKKFKYADQMLCLMDKHNTGSGCFLSELGRKVLSNYSVQFGTTEVRQVRYFKKRFYELAWQKNESSKNIELNIRIPKDENVINPHAGSNMTFTSNRKQNIRLQHLNKRREELKRALIAYTRKIHDKFLKNKRISEEEYSYDTQSTWHSDFNPETYVPELPLADLPENPFKSTKVTKNGVSQSDTKSMRSFLSRYAPSRNIEQEIFGKELHEQLQFSKSKKFANGRQMHQSNALNNNPNSYSQNSMASQSSMSRLQTRGFLSHQKPPSSRFNGSLGFSNYKDYLKSNGKNMKNSSPQQQEYERNSPIMEETKSETNTIDPTEDLELKIMKILKQKEAALKEAKEKKVNGTFAKEQSKVNLSAKNLKRVAMSLKMYFSMRKVKNVFLLTAIDYVYKGCKFQGVGQKRDIEEAILELVRLSSGWIKLKIEKASKQRIINLVSKSKFSACLANLK